MIKQLTIEDGIFIGSAVFKDGTEFNFSVTREEIVTFLLRHKKAKLTLEVDGRTPLNDRKLIANYVEQSERVYILERRRANPSQHGGARAGSGRKPKDGVATQTITLRLRKDYLELIRLNYIDRSSFIQLAVKNQLIRDGLIR